MTKLEKLAEQIYKECKADGEPVTKEEALEMAQMELGAKDIKNYTQSEVTKKKSVRERKVDAEKGLILGELKETLENMGVALTAVKTETEIKFEYNGNSYTLKLTKHRPKK